jgi:hypothetical protein
LADVKENHAWSQAWYFPRKATTEVEYLVYVHETEEPFDVAAMLAWKAEQDPMTAQALEAAALATLKRGAGGGLFGQFNARYSHFEAMLKRLEARGYELKDQSGPLNGINLDNWTRPIGGESMNTLLTAGEWSDRVLGRSETVTLPARIALAATGNNLSVRGDMTRRSLIIQLDAGVERPELRQFKEPNLPGLVLRRRGELLAALFAILKKGYRQARRPGHRDQLLGRFEPWSMAVAAPIRWLGYPDPTDSQARLREADPEAESVVPV